MEKMLAEMLGGGLPRDAGRGLGAGGGGTEGIGGIPELNDLMKMLGGSGDDPELAQNAQKLWKMLDDMADSDPQAYSSFLAKQVESAKEASPKAETQPAFCIQSATKVPLPSKKVFINVTHCAEVAEPYVDQSLRPSISSASDDSDDELVGMRIPIARTGDPRREKDGTDVFEVAVNSNAVERAAKDAAFRQMLERTILAAVAQFFKIELVERYVVAKFKFRGDAVPAPVALNGKLNATARKAHDAEQASARKVGVGIVDDAKKPLIQELNGNAAEEFGVIGAKVEGSSRRVSNLASKSGPHLAPKGIQSQSRGRGTESLADFFPGGSKSENAGHSEKNQGGSYDSEPLIGDRKLALHGESQFGGGHKIMIEEVEEKKKRPEHTLEEQESQGGVRGMLVLTVSMPDAEGVGEMELDVAEGGVSVGHPRYDLKLSLPKKVRSDDVSAKFNKKKKVLVLKMPLLQS